MTAAILDSQTAGSAGLSVQSGYDSAKKTRGPKRLLLVDTLGHVLGVTVLPADVPERTGARELLDEVVASSTWMQRLYVDIGFRGPDFAAPAAALKPSLKVEVVMRTDTYEGFEVLPKRSVVERVFGRLMRCRHSIVRDRERPPESIVACFHVDEIHMTLRRLTCSSRTSRIITGFEESTRLQWERR